VKKFLESQQRDNANPRPITPKDVQLARRIRYEGA